MVLCVEGCTAADDSNGVESCWVPFSALLLKHPVSASFACFLLFYKGCVRGATRRCTCRCGHCSPRARPVDQRHRPVLCASGPAHRVWDRLLGAGSQSVRLHVGHTCSAILSLVFLCRFSVRFVLGCPLVLVSAAYFVFSVYPSPSPLSHSLYYRAAAWLENEYGKSWLKPLRNDYFVKTSYPPPSPPRGQWDDFDDFD